MKRFLILAPALALAASAALAQPYGPGYGPGGGGYGPGMMGGGYGPGYGPGMMGGYGPGYGRGMMGGGYGYGPGAGRGYGLAALDLTSEQQDKIFAIQEEAHAKNFGTMSKIRAEQYKLGKLYNAEKADPKAVAEQQKKVDELRRQVIQSRVETRNQIEAVLTPEQRKQFKSFRPWWGPDDAD